MKRKIRKREIILFSVLIGLMVTPIIFNSMTPIALNSNSDYFDENNLDVFKLPKTSGTQINITTPKNKTYYNPMSGYFPASFGFDNDEDDSFPDGWIDSDQTGCETKVIASKEGHNRVVQLYDGSPSYSAVADNIFTPRTNGTIELWALYSDPFKDSYIQMQNAGTNVLRIRITHNYIQVLNGSIYQNIRSIKSNTWYHIRIDYECGVGGGYQGLSQYRWHVYINQILYGDYAFMNNEDEIDTFILRSELNDHDHYCWFDAVGFSWDKNYNIGDNKKEGLTLSFNKDTDLDWMGYSLDGQANRTILGNATIPMPANGLHTIRVFGNDSFGTMYQSDVRYFNVSLIPKPKTINLISPEAKTYTAPMSSYFPASFGFDNDDDDSFPDGWSDSDQTGCETKVIASKEGHNKVVQLYDGSPSYSAVADNIFTPRTNGTVELWALYSDPQKDSYIQMQNAGTNVFRIRITNNYIQAYNGSIYQNIRSINNNTWYHIRIDYECRAGGGYQGLSQYRWHVYINQILYGDYGFMNNEDNVDTFILRSELNDWDHYCWFDAVGFSWDKNYNIGDNKEEGLLLSFEKIINNDWMWYSLDGQANRTILGITTIPMPANGLHSIQIFGNDSFGTMYQSDVRYFTVSTIDLINPPNDDDDDDDDDQGEDENFNFVFWFLIIPLITVTANVTGVAYVIRHKKKKEPKLKKKLPDKIKLQAKKEFLNKNLTINNLKLSGQNPEEIKMVLEKIFRNKEDRDLILYELNSFPEGFFAKFKKSYDKSIKELELEKSEYVLNNDNYFDEGKGKSE